MVGHGPLAARIRARKGDNIKMVDRLSFAELKQAYSRCKALIFTAEEDFGIIPVEVAASGRPVLAYGGGGALETVTDGVSGLFFEEQTTDSLIEGVRRMKSWTAEFRPELAVQSVQRFAPGAFDLGILQALAGEER
jgi:glycosyltransferase involved in cell wall biosynthesis